MRGAFASILDDSKLVLVLLAGACVANGASQQGVALVLAGDGLTVLRAGDELPLPAAQGELLFAGDTLRSAGGVARVLYCPSQEALTLAPHSSLIAGARKVVGKIAARNPSLVCALPKLERDVSDAYGTREAAPGGRLADLQPERRAAYEREKAVLDALPGKDLAVRIARAELDVRFGLRRDATVAWRQMADEHPEAAWMRAMVHEVASSRESAAEPVIPTARRRTSPPSADLARGNTYALIVGISQYQRLAPAQQLRFARADAELFERHLRSPRGGSISAANIVALSDGGATTAAIRNAIHTFLRVKARRNDTVIVFVAAHGEGDREGGGYVITHDSDPEDLRSTAFPMSELQKLMEEELAHVGRVELYVDVCRAGTIGTLRRNRINQPVADLLRIQQDAEVIGLLSSGPKEVSYESPRFGGGHGAFSYFLLDGLLGRADLDGDGVITVDELIQHVKSKVSKATRERQHPVEDGYFFAESRLAEGFAEKAGVTLTGWTDLPDTKKAPPPALTAQLSAADVRRAPLPDLPEAADFLAAVQQSDYDAAWVQLPRLAAAVGRVGPAYREFEDRLRVAVQDAAQAVLLRYLSGEQSPQRRDDFERGARWFDLALRLDPGTAPIESKAEFSHGRVFIFDKRYAEAEQRLIRSIRLNPAGAYAYNALGIALLEQSRFEDAARAFRDAARRAPHWAYPLHNLALVRLEIGDANGAIAAYRQAMQLAPAHFYIPYNLGLVYQRLNQGRDAEEAFKKALALGPDAPEIRNALGYLKQSTGNRAEAERFYREAIARDENFLPARHNLALLLSTDRSRVDEALALWQALLAAHPKYLPAWLKVAETLASNGRRREAIDAYREVLKIQPGYAAARLAAAALLSFEERPEEAREVLQPLLTARGGNPRVQEALGDIEARAGRPAEERAAYERALRSADDPEMKSRLRKKLKSVH